MNAGSSGTGQAFALRNCDEFFTATNASRKSIEGTAKKVAEVKAQVRTFDRDIEVYTVGHVICHPTQQEADEYCRPAFIDNADWAAVERMMALRNLARESLTRSSLLSATTSPPMRLVAILRWHAGQSRRRACQS
jgi:FMNH2-dependent dimethyl sulfone monooxygenase